MSELNTQRSVREGSIEKRTAIIASSRELFIRHGVDGVSMDAVAAHAGVSKTTVYAYFGNKRQLFLAVLADASESLTATTRHALERHLGDGVAIASVAEFEEALTAFTLDLGMTVYSANYAAIFALVAQQRVQKPDSGEDLFTAAAEDAQAERIAHFIELGLLDTDNPRLAADHYNALTLLLAYNDQPDPVTADLARVRRSMIDGVHAFIRAYAVR